MLGLRSLCCLFKDAPRMNGPPRTALQEKWHVVWLASQGKAASRGRQAQRGAQHLHIHPGAIQIALQQRDLIQRRKDHETTGHESPFGGNDGTEHGGEEIFVPQREHFVGAGIKMILHTDLNAAPIGLQEDDPVRH